MAFDSQSPLPARVNVLGVGISVLNLDTTMAAVASALAERRKGYVCVTGVHGVSEAQHDPEFRRILNRSFLNTPDGMPMVWMGHLRGHRQMGRVYGPDLMERVFDFTRESGHTHFFYGGAPGVAEELKVKMEARFPGARVVGTFTPPFRPLDSKEIEELQRTIKTLQPDMIWVGLSTPKQERFMAEFGPQLDVTLMFGVGAAFDFFAGRVKQAPRWMQRSGLEWLFRFGCEPRRLWKRYLKNNPLFVWRAAGQLLGWRNYQMD
jgi:N-acetylglucosaminyldiphosphoundecaprenol N-acetyl-beta-D-mannosaminyltransferase